MDSGEQTKEETWYALRTWNCKELTLAEYLRRHGLTVFIPMVYTNFDRRGEKTSRHLVPAIHNYLFLRNDIEQKPLETLLKEQSVPCKVYCKIDSTDFYEIPAPQMNEFRFLCDPAFEGVHYVTRDQIEAKVGHEVRIVKGPFAGITGKLIRKKNEYYFIKTLLDAGVMIRISRWYCEPLDQAKA